MMYTVLYRVRTGTVCDQRNILVYLIILTAYYVKAITKFFSFLILSHAIIMIITLS